MFRIRFRGRELNIPGFLLAAFDAIAMFGLLFALGLRCQLLHHDANFGGGRCFGGGLGWAQFSGGVFGKVFANCFREREFIRRRFDRIDKAFDL